MSILSLRLPESIHKQVKEISRKEGISINQFIANAVAEKMSAFLTRDYLEMRSKRANKSDFKKALSQIPDIEPEEFDRL
ncbi:MAG: toxin-antitoxin system HicB family antitoxin [Calditrichaceae bacterium]|nr:toxin-antitoxin system HicB family antitoxin [Calditrichaceae bacterium]MBN2710019.1 toxin-antitoxin system HicB family antitoxin [Calditrichaceae bacterium]RQV93677.1 MAG: toxin-antitoxin system HicB family antitoxin [Calditrichota bacterium]